MIGDHPSDWLRSHFIHRKKRNQQYSLRSFSRDIGVSSGRLSEWLNRRRDISQKSLKRIVPLLEADSRKATRVLRKFASPHHNEEQTNITLDQFAAIADWYHYGILSLMATDDFEPDSGWISRRLGVHRSLIDDALIRLTKLGMIERTPDGIRRSCARLNTPDDVASNALKKAHQQTLDMAKQAITEISPELREVSSVTMAIDVQQIPKAKKAIRKFRDTMESLLETGQRTQVYELTVCLTPLSKVAGRS